MIKNGFDTTNFSVTPFQKRVEKPWGYEIIYSPDHAPSTGKILHVMAGKRLSLQYHDEKIETMCLIKGRGRIVLTGADGVEKEYDMEPYKGYFVQPGQIHRLIAVTDCVFLETSTPETGNTYRLQDDANRPTETEEMRKSENRGWSGSK
ncbi:MAG: cupin [Patescibacteria group bacterium]|nr:cupin [Patescibacteria group bacterium]